MALALRWNKKDFQYTRWDQFYMFIFITVSFTSMISILLSVRLLFPTPFPYHFQYKQFLSFLNEPKINEI